MKFTKKEIILLLIGIILIAGLILTTIKMIGMRPITEKPREEPEKVQPLEERVGVTPPLVEEKVYLDGEIKEVNSKENYLVIIPTWVDAWLIDKIQVNKEVRIDIIPGKTSLTRVKLIEPTPEELKKPEELKEPEQIQIKIDEFKVGDRIHIEGKWNEEKDILEPLSIVAIELVKR